MSDDAAELNTKELDAFLRALGRKVPQARVGILGKKTNRRDMATNAEIGAKHEFGSDGMPVRSFLRMPLTEELPKYLGQSELFTEATFKEVIREKSIRQWVQKIGIAATVVVQNAFNTGGFGKWKPSDMTRKKVHMTLVETQQLRNSITWDVR